MAEDKKVVYNAEEIVFPQAWPFKTKDENRGVTMGTIAAEMADTFEAAANLKGFVETEWAVAKLPPGVLECCIDEALQQLQNEYTSKYYAIFGPLSTVNLKNMRGMYCLAATSQALVALKEEESKKKHTRSGDTTVVVVVEDDDTTSTAAVVGESPEKRAKKIEAAFETEKKMSGGLP
jgi:hypothetical protein